MLFKEFNINYDIMNLADTNVIILQAYSQNRKLCKHLTSFPSTVGIRTLAHFMKII